MRLIDLIQLNRKCACRCILRPTFKVYTSLFDVLGNLKEISQDLRKALWDSMSLVYPVGNFPTA